MSTKDSFGSGLAEEGFQECPAALQLPSVVGCFIFPLLPVSDLRNCRLVCSMWAEEGTKALIGRSYYHMRELEDVVDFTKHAAKSDSITKLGQLREYHFKISVSLAAEVKEDQNVDYGKSVLDELEFTDLWNAVGNKTTHLELSANSWSCTSLTKLLYSSVPNLRHLRLEYAPVKSLGIAILKFSDMNYLKTYNPQTAVDLQIESFDFFCMDCINYDESALSVGGVEPKMCRRYVMNELIKRMSKLKKFMCNDEQVGEDLFFSLVLENKDEQLYNKELAEFSFPIQINEEEVKRASLLLRYPLKKLDLKLRPGLRFPALYTFLSSLGSTLTVLKIDFSFLSSHIEDFGSGKDLINLESLTLVYFNGPLDFVHYMPKLKNLILIKANLSVSFGNEVDFRRPHGLTSFEVHSGHGNAGRVVFPDTYRSMTKLFPGLKKFRIEYCSDTSLKIITQGFKMLEELVMDNSICSDAGINASLPNLERLHTLYLNSPKLTDRSLEGIGMCKELRKLSLSSPRISGTSLCSFLTNSRLNLYYLELIQCYGVSVTDAFDFEKLLPPGAHIVYNPHS